MLIGHLIEQPHWQGLVPQIEEILFASAVTREFADETARAAFAERWLKRFLARYPESFLIARAQDGRVAGYLAGCLENPATSGRFDDIAYVTDFASLCEAYPAHLHINLDAAFRNRGIGAAMVEAFAQQARRAGVPGVHIVTGAGARNIPFYRRLGFLELATTRFGPGEVVFMGRSLMQA